MRIIKKILFVFVTLVALVLIVALFVNGKYSVEKSIEINQPKSEVFDYLRYLKNQDEYSTWAMKDPKMTKTYKGTDGKVGFVSAWDSKNEDVGKGEQEIIAIKEGERIDYELRFIKPFEATDNAYMITSSKTESNTTVTWGFNGEMNYPFNLFMLFMDMEEMLGPELQKGLENLKANLEETE